MRKILLAIQMVLVVSVTTTWAQNVVTGTVTSMEDDSSLPGVNVLVEGTNEGTITDVDGDFSIEAADDATLVFSYVGYVQEKVPVNNRSVINLQLSPDITELTEVVVTAFGVERDKKALGYSMEEVDGEDVSTVKESNMINSLAGKISGIVITPTAFGPGSSSRVILRGNNSLKGNNQPLYVVDGVPMDNERFGSANSQGIGEYSKTDYGGGISDINPDDIKSISVLKGPNAAALYGSRASNGVILITTKKGSSQKGVGVSLNSNVMFQSPLVLPQLQNEYGQGTQGSVDVERGGSWGAKLDGSSQPYYTGENRPYVAQPDNVENFYRTGSNIVNTISLEGGNEDANVRFSYTNNVSKSIVPNSNINKHNFNLRGFANLSDKLSIDSKITYSNLEGENRITLGTEGIVADLIDIPRNVRLEDLKDYQNEADFGVRTYTQDTDGNVASDGPNPYWVINNDRNDDVRERLLSFVKANYQFTDNFSAFVRVGADFTSQKIESVNQFGHWFYQEGRFNYSQNDAKEINTDFYLTYDASIGSEFNISANFGGNHRYEVNQSQSVSSSDGFKIPTQATVASATDPQPSYSFERAKKVNSLYGSVQLAYRETFFLDLNGRNDWSSTLPEDNRSYFYPNANISVLVNELIDPGHNIFNLLKVRASWAQVGNDTGPFQLHNTFDLIQNGYLGRTTLSRPSIKFDENIEPEEISTIEFGLEWSLFENRIYGDFTYYDITSKNLIWDVPVSQSTGYSTFNTNVGEVRNSGIEFLIGGTPLASDDFSWDISLNMSHNENEMVKLIEDLDNITFTNTNSGLVSVYASVGGGYGDIYGTVYQRDPDGNIIVDDNGIPKETSEKEYLGNYQPDWVGGLSNSLNYKDLTFRFLIDARFGGEVYSGADAGLDASGVSKTSLQYRESGITVDGVTSDDSEDPVYEPNTTNVDAQRYFGGYTNVASNHVFDQTNIRMREMSLVYNLPASLLENTFIQRASIGLVGRNLFFLKKEMDNFDPETSYSSSAFSQGVLFYTLPSTRSYGFNLNVKF